MFRLIYACAAFPSFALAGLIVASLFTAERTPRSLDFLGVSLVVRTVFFATGVLLTGIRRYVVAIAALPFARNGAGTTLAFHVSRLLVYLLAAGSLLCPVLGAPTYGMMERIDRSFAVFD